VYGDVFERRAGTMMQSECGDVEREIFEKITQYFRKRMGVRPTKVAKSTDLADDIGMAGDDAVEFIARYVKESSINEGAEPNFDDYFDPQAGIWPFVFLAPFKALLFPRRRKPSLTVETLIKSWR